MLLETISKYRNELGVQLDTKLELLKRLLDIQFLKVCEPSQTNLLSNAIQVCECICLAHTLLLFEDMYLLL